MVRSSDVASCSSASTSAALMRVETVAAFFSGAGFSFGGMAAKVHVVAITMHRFIPSTLLTV